MFEKMPQPNEKPKTPPPAEFPFGEKGERIVEEIKTNPKERGKEFESLLKKGGVKIKPERNDSFARKQKEKEKQEKPK